MQVRQLEKEKKDLTERLRIISKRLDHTERAFRKEERPLLAQDYERQQEEDRKAHETSQVDRIEGAKLAHQQDLDTKRRLSRMMAEYKERREVYISKRGEEFTKKHEEAARKITEEKEKRKKAVLKAREEERHRLEEEERIHREQEEERIRLEEGKNVFVFCKKIICGYRSIYLIRISFFFCFICNFQNVLRKKNDVRKKKRPQKQRRKKNNERRKRRGLKSVDNARKNDLLPLRPHRDKDSVKKKLRLVVKIGIWNSLQRQRANLLAVVFGGDQHLLRLSRLVLEVLHQIVLHLLLLLGSTFPERSGEEGPLEVDGENVRLQEPVEEEVLDRAQIHLLDLLPPPLSKLQRQMTTMASRLLLATNREHGVQEANGVQPVVLSLVH